MRSALKLTGLYFVVHVPIYNLSLLVIIGYDKARAKVIIEKQGGNPDQLDEWTSYGGLACHEGDTNRFLLHFPDRIPTTVQHYADLQHEVRHLTDFMMEHVGITFNHEHSCEAYPYLTGFLTEQIYGHLWSINNVYRETY